MYKFQIKTKLSKDQILKELDSNTSQITALLGMERSLYTGIVNANCFKIYESRQEQNSFHPIATGKISEGIVTVSLRMSYLTQAFVAIFWVVSLSGLYGESDLFSESSFTYWLFFVVINLFVYIGFIRHINSFKARFSNLLNRE